MKGFDSRLEPFAFDTKKSAHASGARGLGFESRTGQIDTVSFLRSTEQRLATVATFLRSCVAQALSRGDEFRHCNTASVMKIFDFSPLTRRAQARINAFLD